MWTESRHPTWKALRPSSTGNPVCTSESQMPEWQTPAQHRVFSWVEQSLPATQHCVGHLETIFLGNHLHLYWLLTMKKQVSSEKQSPVWQAERRRHYGIISPRLMQSCIWCVLKSDTKPNPWSGWVSSATWDNQMNENTSVQYRPVCYVQRCPTIPLLSEPTAAAGVNSHKDSAWVRSQRLVETHARYWPAAVPRYVGSSPGRIAVDKCSHEMSL